MAEIPSTYEEYLALPSEIRDQLNSFRLKEIIESISKSTLTEDEWEALNSEGSD